MTVGDFPALGYGLGNCQHGVPLYGYCWACSNSGAYAPLPSITPPQGWRCPVCSGVMSPSMVTCLYCPAPEPTVTMTMTTNTVNIGTMPDAGEESARQADAPADRLRVRLPDVMLHEGHQQIRALSAGWAEVFPGLQAKLADIESSPVDPPILLLRLTPADAHPQD